MRSGFYGYVPSRRQSRFHSSVTFRVMRHPWGENKSISSSFDPQEFNSLYPIVPALSNYSPHTPTTLPVALRWIMVGVIEMAAAPREEEEGEDYPRLNIFHIKLLFSNATFRKWNYSIIASTIELTGAPLLESYNYNVGNFANAAEKQSIIVVLRCVDKLKYGQKSLNKFLHACTRQV